MARRIHVQVGDNAMEPISGQLLFNFDQAELKRLVSFPDRKKTDESRGTTRIRGEVVPARTGMRANGRSSGRDQGVRKRRWRSTRPRLEHG